MSYTVINLSLMTQNNLTSTDNARTQPLLARADFIFTAAALSVVTALLLPLPVKIIDILWVCSLCLTAAVLLITLLAKNSSELGQLPALIVIVTLVRMALCTASARFILLAGSGGIILEITANYLPVTGIIWTITISLITAMLALLLIHKAAGSITKSSLNFTTQILQLKNIGLENDLNTGLIDSEKGKILRQKIDRETQFYLDMAGVTKLLRCDVIIAATIIILALISQTVVTAMDNSNITASLETYSSLIAAASLLTFLPAILTSFALAHLLGRASLTLNTDTSNENNHPPQTIEIISQETGRVEEVQLLNPDFVKTPKPQTQSNAPKENVVDFEPIENTQSDTLKSDMPDKPTKLNSMDQYYNRIAQHIDNPAQPCKTLLLAAENTEDLPVTIAVNVAINLAKKKHRTLIVDADFERNPVAKAFDIQPDKTKSRAVRTCIDKLSLCTSRQNVGGKQSNLALIVKKAVEIYNKVIIYAPDINTNSAPIFAEIAECTIVFTDSSDNQICKLLQPPGAQAPIVMSPPEKTA